MSCNYCYHSADDHEGGDDCGDGGCLRCAAKREEERRDRLDFLLSPRSRDRDRHFSGIEQADMYLNEALMINDRRMLLDEVRRLRRELDTIRYDQDLGQDRITIEEQTA